MEQRNTLRRLRRIALDRGLYIEGRSKSPGLFHLVNLDTNDPFATSLTVEEIEAFFQRGGCLGDAQTEFKARA